VKAAFAAVVRERKVPGGGLRINRSRHLTPTRRYLLLAARERSLARVDWPFLVPALA
jgi:hypothetical protein